MDEILFWDEARLKMFTGIEKTVKTVASTLWPKGRNVIFAKGKSTPQITNDGVTIAKSIELKDPIENMWAMLIKEVANKTNERVWDWTTTASLLAYAMIKEWLREIRSWTNAVEIRNWMKEIWEEINEELEKITKKLETNEEIEQVATISAQDDTVWKIIAKAMEKVGRDWVITVESGQTFWLEVELTEWMKFETWYISPYMVNNSDKMEARYENPSILITDKKISSLKDILKLLEQIASTGKRDLVIIAEDIDWEALPWIIINKAQWIFNILWIKAPWFWDRKKEMLKDLAVLTWANFITDDMGKKLSDITIEDLWSAWVVMSTKDSTTITWWIWSKESIETRIEEIKSQIKLEKNAFQKEKLQERLWKLTNWIAVIKVWAASELEMKERKLRIEDALNATKAAVEEWIVAGWWTILAKLSHNFCATAEWDKWIWQDIVIKALSYPIKKIAENAWKSPDIIFNTINGTELWYNAAKDEYCDMILNWIIDPKKVIRVALENAISVASSFLTTEAIVYVEEKEQQRPLY